MHLKKKTKISLNIINLLVFNILQYLITFGMNIFFNIAVGFIFFNIFNFTKIIKTQHKLGFCIKKCYILLFNTI